MDELQRGREHMHSRDYKEMVEKIKELRWYKLDSTDLQNLMYLSYISAQEFAEALRIALKMHPKNENLKAAAQGELQTGNLALDDYTQSGDHADFLDHFLRKHNLVANEQLASFGATYLEKCKQLPDEVRAMSIFSREEELSGIFEKVLGAPDWSAPDLAEFRHFLEKHIQLDTGEGGHHDLTKELPIDGRVRDFYEARLNMYKALPKLFENGE